MASAVQGARQSRRAGAAAVDAGLADLQGERPGLGHVRLTTLDGTDLYIAVCAFPLFTSQQQFDGALVIFWKEDAPS